MYVTLNQLTALKGDKIIAISLILLARIEGAKDRSQGWKPGGRTSGAPNGYPDQERWCLTRLPPHTDPQRARPKQDMEVGVGGSANLRAVVNSIFGGEQIVFDLYRAVGALGFNCNLEGGRALLGREEESTIWRGKNFTWRGRGGMLVFPPLYQTLGNDYLGLAKESHDH